MNAQQPRVTEAGRRRPRLRELELRYRDEPGLQRALSRFLEQDALDDCVVDVPRRMVHVRYVAAWPLARRSRCSR